MKSIMMSYPGFPSLPRGVRKLLLTSESFFFEEADLRLAGCLDGLVTAKERPRMGTQGAWRTYCETGVEGARLSRVAG